MTKGRIDIVSASAGSGKTTRLARELEHAVTELGIAPDRIVATTFTRKAAAELVGRGRDFLLRKGRPDDAELFRAARIGTVNAVAGMLVSEFAFEAGVSPELIVLDETRAEETFRRSFGDVVSRDDLAELARLSGCFDEFPWPSIVRQIADDARMNRISLDALDGDRERSVRGFFELFDEPTERGDVLDARLEAALDTAITRLREKITQGADPTKKSAETLAAYERAKDHLRAQRSLPWPSWVELAHLAAASKSDAACEEVRRAAGVLLRHPTFREDNELAIRLCFDLARRSLAAYQRFKSARRAIDFIDQETIALALLDREDVKEVLAEEVSLVLVDEFQDSSPLELALFLALARIAPRSVWVGDQKQAIYGFRGADPSLMEAVIAEVLHGKEPETLSVGRRSRAPLVHLTNALFVPPFGEAGLSAARVALEPAIPEDAERLGPCVERWRLDLPSGSGAAAELALSMRHLLDDPSVYVRGEEGAPRRVRPGDIAVLCRRRETCLAVATALGKVDIAAEVALGGLLGTPEGRAASAGLGLWVHPDDMLARAELARLTEPGAASIDILLRGDDPDRWRDVDPIARLLGARDVSPFAGALEAFDAVARALRLDDLVARWGRGKQGLANLDALRAHAVTFVRLARHRGGAASPAALVAYLEGLAESLEDAQATPGGGHAVSITTWHAAKGLEWPIVVLYELDGTFSRSALGVHVDDRRGRGPLLQAPLAGRTIRYWPSPLRFQRSPLTERLRAHPIAAEASENAVREELRLLYVGFTRARDRLVLASSRDLSEGTLRLFTRGGGAPLAEPMPARSREGVSLVSVDWGGRQTSVAVRRPAPRASLVSSQADPAHAEILDRPSPRTYAPALLAPSNLEGQGSVLDIERIGPRVSARATVDPAALGSAVHAFLASDRPGLDEDDRAELAARLLDAWGVAEALPVEDVLALGRRFSDWLGTRWPGAILRREWPVEHRLAAGTLVRGKLDLLVMAGETLVVIDHKVVLAGELDALEEIRGAHGQLRAYADALLAAGAASVQVRVHLPLAGLVARLG
ncbi:UvrD-helicase domain-containing protein [Polyangium jinanense]|uniref:DNA 3'-5' helicase n=1 Tax=Polyangium jinanense TaxID=2829994 RepID=A0A9X3XDV3_9BACT|nr:UvrD-helicase domain-containing protein [Polyangium jinanense]MDC3959012.1 UvrD-helicase domain-containing protein [Polyangium jinanense]MDC3988487.1 UvrD-helicase domain-containing protein [Polyangium jinanense]